MTQFLLNLEAENKMIAQLHKENESLKECLTAFEGEYSVTSGLFFQVLVLILFSHFDVLYLLFRYVIS